METGVIATLRSDRGFGFIRPDNASSSGEIFFHFSAVEQTTFEELYEGQRVRFDQEPDPRNPNRSRAAHVAPVGEGS